MITALQVPGGVVPRNSDVSVRCAIAPDAVICYRHPCGEFAIGGACGVGGHLPFDWPFLAKKFQPAVRVNNTLGGYPQARMR